VPLLVRIITTDYPSQTQRGLINDKRVKQDDSFDVSSSEKHELRDKCMTGRHSIHQILETPLSHLFLYVDRLHISLHSPLSTIIHSSQLDKHDLIVFPATFHRRFRCLSNTRRPKRLPKANACLRVFRSAIGNLVRRASFIVVPILGVCLCGTEALGKYVREEAAQGGHADAEDTDEGFEYGPVGCGHAVVGWVGGGGELDEGLEPNDGYDGRAGSCQICVAT
jgi:hypothetical protein